jgi:hypothetical protein
MENHSSQYRFFGCLGALQMRGPLVAGLSLATYDDEEVREFVLDTGTCGAT